MSRKQQRRAPPAPRPAPRGPRPGGQQFQPPSTGAAGSQLGGGPGLFTQPGDSNMFAMDLLQQGGDESMLG